MNDLEDISGIYCYINLVNNKKYTGQSINLKVRINAHERNFTLKRYTKLENHGLWHGVKKYGRENFELQIIEYCDESKLDNRERYWIKKLKSHTSQHGYNIDWGGKGVGRMSEETRRKISRAHIGKTVSEETRRRMSHGYARRKTEGSCQYIGVRGPTFLSKKWVVEFKHKGRIFRKQHYYESELEAAQAYDAYCIENNLDVPLNFGE